MNYNRFFIINHDLSKSTNDQVFYYNRVVLDQTVQSGSGDYPLYPFYITFKPYRIDFCYYGPKVVSNTNSYGLPELEHKVIFSLSLSFDYSVNDLLTGQLVDLFDAEFSYSKIYKFNKSFDFQEKGSAVFSYNNLEKALTTIQLPRRGYEGNRIRLRVMLLDFLFDLNEVKKKYNDFNYCPFFDEIETRLRQNDFFNAIATKFSYYYNLDRLQELSNDNEGVQYLDNYKEKSKKLNRLSQDSIFIGKLCSLVPERFPVTSLDEPSIRDLIHKEGIGFTYNELLDYLDSRMWEDESEKRHWIEEFFAEYRQKYEDDHSRLKIELNKFIDVRNKWIKILHKTNTPSYILTDYKWWKHFEEELEIVSFENNISAHLKFLKKDDVNRNETAKWYSNRYEVIKSLLLVLRLPFSNGSNVKASLLQKSYLLLAVYIAIIFCFYQLIKVWTLISHGFNDLISNTSTKLVYFSLAHVALALCLLLYFIYQGILNHVKHKKVLHNSISIRTAGFFMPRLAMAIISGWLLLVLAGEELWKFELDLRPRHYILLSGGLLFLMYLLLYLEVVKINPKTVRSAWVRTLMIIYIGLVYSFIIGFVVMMITGRKVIERSDILEKYAYNVISNNSTYAFANSKKRLNLPVFKPDLSNYQDTLNVSHFKDLKDFKRWLSDQYGYGMFVNDSLYHLVAQKWQNVYRDQMKLYHFLDTIQTSYNRDSLVSIISLIDNREYLKITCLDTFKKRNNNFYKEIPLVNEDTLARRVLDILDSRMEAVREVNNQLLTFSFPRPQFDHYLYVDFLEHVRYDDSSWWGIDTHICLVELVVVPALIEKEYKADGEPVAKESDINCNNSVIIFPGYYILNSVLALFIGVFLQMIFEKKNVVEPI